jgi:hypothetical protein
MQQQKSKHISLSHDDDGDEDYHQASEEEDDEENVIKTPLTTT